MYDEARFVLKEQEAFLLRTVRSSSALYGYRVHGRQGIFSKSIVEAYGVAEVLDDFPGWAVRMGRVAPQSVDDWLGLFDAIDRGEPHGFAKVFLKSGDDAFSRYWLRFDTFPDEAGNPFFAIVTFDDIGREYEYSRQQSQDISGLLQATRKIFPELLTLNLTKGAYRMISYHSATTLGTPREGPIDNLIKIRLGGVVEEDRESFAAFFSYASLQDAFIRDGKETVQLAYRRPGKDGGVYWVESTVMRQDNEMDDDVLLVAMSRGIDAQKAEEARLRELLRQQMEELRLTTNRANRTICTYDVPTRTLTVPLQYAQEKHMPQVVHNYPESLFTPNRDLLPETLETLSGFFGAIRRGDATGICEIPFKVSDTQDVIWKRMDFATIYDSAGKPLRAIIFVDDITARMELQNRSERDGMTGLLNRSTAEARIRKLMAEDRGILLLLDLDDLKGINDTFGHREGDRAILGIAETLRPHFRETDVIARIGGDEFMAYLPGAAENPEAIAASLSTLLRKLTSIPIGAQNERRIHCSIGAAVQTEAGDSFDSLFKQADTALYHVKRNGKNHYAFYSREMDQADYHFRAQRLLTLQTEKKFELTEIQQLLSSIASFYQMVLSANLSANDYYLLENSESTEDFDNPIQSMGSFDRLMDLFTGSVHPDDAPAFSAVHSRQAILAAYEDDGKNVQHYFRYKYRGEYRWAESTVIYYTNEQGDVCCFILLRWADERAHELEQLWLQKVLELAVKTSFEYICLINADSGEYFLYGDEKNTHGVPQKGDFDQVTRSIRDSLIRPEAREEYYENARLDSVAAKMRGGRESFSYRYTLPDGERETTFHWFEPTHTQLLMTVQRR